MNVSGELDLMVEHRIQFAFKGKFSHLSKVNIPNIAYPNQYIDIEIPHGSRDHVIVLDTVKITFNLDIESTDKARSLFVCLLSLFQVGIYNSIKTNKNQPSSLYKK